MEGGYSIRNVAYERTIYIRMTGRFDFGLMQAFAAEYRQATDSYQGGDHLVLADMRGLSPLLPEVGHVFAAAVGYARAHGPRSKHHEKAQRRLVARSGAQRIGER